MRRVSLTTMALSLVFLTASFPNDAVHETIDEAPLSCHPNDIQMGDSWVYVILTDMHGIVLPVKASAVRYLRPYADGRMFEGSARPGPVRCFAVPKNANDLFLIRASSKGRRSKERPVHPDEHLVVVELGPMAGVKFSPDGQVASVDQIPDPTARKAHTDALLEWFLTDSSSIAIAPDMAATLKVTEDRFHEMVAELVVKELQTPEDLSRAYLSRLEKLGVWAREIDNEKWKDIMVHHRDPNQIWQ